MRRANGTHLWLLFVALGIAACGEDEGGRFVEVTTLHGQMRADPAFFAYQGPDGSWQAGKSLDAGRYQVPVTDDRYAIAWRCSDDSWWAVRAQVLWTTVTEAPAVEIPCLIATDSTAVGAVGGLDDGRNGAVAMRVTQDVDLNWDDPTFEVRPVFLAEAEVVGSQRTELDAPDKMVVARGIDPPMTGEFDVTVNVDAADAFETIARELVAPEPKPGEVILRDVYFRTEHGTYANVNAQLSGTTFGEVPESAQDPLDMHLASVRVFQNDVRTFQIAHRTFKTAPEGVHLALPTVLDGVHVSYASRDPLRLVVDVPSRAEARIVEFTSFASTVGLDGMVTRGALEDDVFHIELPDLRQVEGWKPAYDLPGDGDFNWEVTVHDDDRDDDLLLRDLLGKSNGAAVDDMIDWSTSKTGAAGDSAE